MIASPFQGMWLIALFDLPVDTVRRRREYTRFRKRLLKDGFIMLQYSVYARYCPSEEAGAVHRKLIRENCPEEGEVRTVILTEHQYGKMEVFSGGKRKPAEVAPAQLEFF